MNRRKRYPRRFSLSRLILMILIVAAIITNPTKEDFYDWANNKAIEDSETIVEGAIKNLLISPLLKSVTVRKNYVLFSTFTIEFDEYKTRYLGIFDNFIELKDKD